MIKSLKFSCNSFLFNSSSIVANEKAELVKNFIENLGKKVIETVSDENFQTHKEG